MNESVVVSEALVAIPFVAKNRTINNLDDIQFLNLGGHKDPKKARELINAAVAGEEVPESISQMVQSMQRHVLPPKFDFVKFDSIDPFVIYMFEFEHEFDKGDLRNMWQNTAPPSGQNFKILSSNISHYIKLGEMFGSKEQ